MPEFNCAELEAKIKMFPTLGNKLPMPLIFKKRKVLH
jgi:hypothetical protein